MTKQNGDFVWVFVGAGNRYVMKHKTVGSPSYSINLSALSGMLYHLTN